MTVLRSGSASDVGRVRTINQDIPLERPNLYAVADGMGGHAGGEVAARVAVETLEEAFERAPTSDGLRDAFSEANTAIWRESQANLDLRGMGTTLTAVALVGGPDGHDVLTLGNVGDSRAYLFTEGHMVQVTDDHSLAEERMRQGEMTEAEAAIHPQRHILTRALGVSSEVEADMWELHLRTGDRLLLCSDGLSNEVGTDEMAEILEAVDDPEEAANRLVEVANDHGGSDNITVVIVDVQVGEQGNGKPSVATPLAVRPGEATGAAAAADSPAPEGDGPPGPGQATGPATDLAATALLASVVRDDETAIVPAREVLAPGARLGFGDEQDQASLAEEGPHSDEFFVGSIASVPLSRSTSRVPPPGDPGARPLRGEGKSRRPTPAARHPAPHHAARHRLRPPRGRRAGRRLLRHQVVRLRQLVRDAAGRPDRGQAGPARRRALVQAESGGSHRPHEQPGPLSGRWPAPGRRAGGLADQRPVVRAPPPQRGHDHYHHDHDPQDDHHDAVEPLRPRTASDHRAPDHRRHDHHDRGRSHGRGAARDDADRAEHHRGDRRPGRHHQRHAVKRPIMTTNPPTTTPFDPLGRGFPA